MALALLAAACGGGEEEADDTTTTTESTTTTTRPDDEPPPLNNTGEDFVGILESISNYENWVFQHPDPTLLDSYVDPQCPCYAESRSSLETLQENSWRARSDQTLYRDIEVLNRPSDDAVTLSLIVEVQDLAIVNTSNEVVREFPVPEPTRSVIDIARDEDHWRILSTTALEPE